LIINEKLPEQLKKRGRKKELSLIGQLGSMKNTLGGKVDIAIMQSVVTCEEVKELVKGNGRVIVDECHQNTETDSIDTLFYYTIRVCPIDTTKKCGLQL
jgi:superfamily II DNA or RNA helicase